MPKRRQAIIWTNADPIRLRIYEALGGDELTVFLYIPQRYRREDVNGRVRYTLSLDVATERKSICYADVTYDSAGVIHEDRYIKFILESKCIITSIWG